MMDENCYVTNKLLEKIKYFNLQNDCKADINAIYNAILYAKECHQGQYRDSGEPYYTHPLEVAYMVCDYCFKTDVIITAILHDVIEDTESTKTEISELFGENVAQGVMDLTRVKENGAKISSAELVNYLFKQKKYDMLIIKQFDRLHNMRTIKAKSLEKIQKIIHETIITFTVLAAHLKIKNVEDEIIYLCSKYIDQKSMPHNFEDKLNTRDAYLLSLVLKRNENLD